MFVRIASAVVIGSAVVLLSIISEISLLFNVVILLVVAVALYEFYSLALSGCNTARLLGVFVGVVMSSCIIARLSFEELSGVWVLLLFVVFIYHMFTASEAKGVAERIGMTVFGVGYIAITIPYFGLLKQLSDGTALVLLVLVPTWMGDSAAYFIGRYFGKHRLHFLSPNKTWEGLVAGIVGCVIGALLIGGLMLPHIGREHIFAVGLGVGIVSPLGDLAESAIKRSYGVKDSGRLIPGHGGVLDRIDSLVFAAPLIYYYFKFAI